MTYLTEHMVSIQYSYSAIFNIFWATNESDLNVLWNYDYIKLIFTSPCQNPKINTKLAN